MSRRHGLAAAVAAGLFVLLSGRDVSAGDHFAVVITGASGGEAYAQKYDGWRQSLVATLSIKLGYPSDHIIVLAEREAADARLATRDNVQRVFGDLRQRLAKDDQLFVVLMGHGAPLDTEDAKFNLVGPDMSASEWAEILQGFSARVVFADTTAASAPFLRKLAAKGRVVMTATDSSAQQYETVFADFFVKAFTDPAADFDKNERVSLWEAFTYASAGVKQWYEQRGQLATERPLLDDTGAGVGREAQNPGQDGAIAQTTYLETDRLPGALADTTLSALLRRRSDLESLIGDLKGRKGTLPADEYEAQLEKLLLELARVSQQIRTKS